jgi:hypothetical protein
MGVIPMTQFSDYKMPSAHHWCNEEHRGFQAKLKIFYISECCLDSLGLAQALHYLKRGRHKPVAQET